MKEMVFQTSGIILGLLLLLLSCGSSLQNNTDKSFPGREISEEWKSFWHQGLAEVSEYELDQARYGENHPGTAVLIFVTEPFNTDLQVKADEPEYGSKNQTEVLKMNAVRHFKTGVYDYSVMESVFTPVNTGKAGESLKATCSVQDWCGQVFSQYNLKNNAYRRREFSYFEKEADSDIIIRDAILEDEIWTLLRLDPALLPSGEVNMIPSMHFLRFRHLPSGPYKAEASLTKSDSISSFHLKYSEPYRELRINFNTQFPYEIQSWEEIYESGFGDKTKKLSTKAILKKRAMMEYWNLNKRSDFWE